MKSNFEHVCLERCDVTDGRMRWKAKRLNWILEVTQNPSEECTYGIIRSIPSI